MAYDPSLYMHELDIKAFNAMNALPKFIRLKEAFVAKTAEKAGLFDIMSTAIRITDKQFPEVYELLPPICEKLGIDVPELYYLNSKEINAFTVGTDRPFVCVTSRMVKEMPSEMISTALAHECAHIACGHYLYHYMAEVLINNINNRILAEIPVLGDLLTPAVSAALKLWDRCSELSADRAAALCDGTSDTTIDLLLKIHGYNNINRNEFLKQALDLEDFVNESKANKMLELMATQDESHPRLAIRARECYKWTRTQRFTDILNGTITSEPPKEKPVTEEIIKADITFSDADLEISRVNEQLEKVCAELDRYTNTADGIDYFASVVSGITASVIDSILFSEDKDGRTEIGLAHKRVNNFIESYAGSKGLRKDLKSAIADLEKTYRVAQDNVWNGAGIKVSAKNHHLADLAHHPTPLGLVCAIVVQFMRAGVFVNRGGEWKLLLVKTSAKDIIEIYAPVVITGILNWLAHLAEKEYEDDGERKISPHMRKLIHLAASTPMIVEIAECADNWFGHLVSDMGGSKNTPGHGMGIPGALISLFYELAAMPGFKDTGLPQFINDLYEKQKIDLRHEIPVYNAAGRQLIPVAFNEISIRLFYFLTRLGTEVTDTGSIKNVSWEKTIPFGNRTIDRMITVSSLTFSFADTADAAVRAALDSGADWVLFSGKFVSRFNYAGAGRAALAVRKEFSSEKKEVQLLHERRLLSEEKAVLYWEKVQRFKYQLEERVSNYLAEDICSFIEGLDDISQGLDASDSDRVIRGTVTIQKVLGREPQFTNQKEFDEIIESDTPLKL